ncbi:MAG: hypothetical protein KC635_03130, partial [Myxococcales bacterium]|nr:hypothetical protein [Myxococcales bacterium]
MSAVVPDWAPFSAGFWVVATGVVLLACGVGVVYGGRSSEHAISCVSAGSILRHLDPDRFEVVAIGIARDGSWLRTDVDPDALAIADGRLPEVSGAAETPLARAAEILASVDVVFPILHGPYGEDGTIQ